MINLLQNSVSFYIFQTLSNPKTRRMASMTTPMEVPTMKAGKKPEQRPKPEKAPQKAAVPEVALRKTQQNEKAAPEHAKVDAPSLRNVQQNERAQVERATLEMPDLKHVEQEAAEVAREVIAVFNLLRLAKCLIE